VVAVDDDRLQYAQGSVIFAVVATERSSTGPEC
jgi:hypothetical protein